MTYRMIINFNAGIYCHAQDLRLHDNPALTEAARVATKLGGSMTLLYVHSPKEDGDDWKTGTSWRISGAGLLWQRDALDAFNKDVIARYGPGAAVVMKTGPYLEAITEVCTSLGAWHVFCNRRYEPSAAQADTQVWDALAVQGYQVHTFNAALLREPWDVKIDMRQWAGHFGTLTPFMKVRYTRVYDAFHAGHQVPVNACMLPVETPNCRRIIKLMPTMMHL